MASEELKRRVEELRQKRKETDSPRWDKFKRYLRNTVVGTVIAGAVAAGPTYYFVKDYITKRQNPPERNVIIRTSNTTYIAGNKEKRAAAKADRESITQFYEGGGLDSKVGTKLAHTTRELRGDIEYFNVYDMQNIRVASATQKPERFQAGLRVGGAFTFKEQFAEIVLPGKTKAPQKYMVYKFAPERGWESMDSDVIEYPIEAGLKENDLGIIEEHQSGEKSIRRMFNRLVEERNSLGWFYGKEFRTSTLLSDYARIPENHELALKFFEKTKELDSAKATDVNTRERLVKEIMKIEEDMKKQPIYASREDGFFKILPQDSVTYLGENPNQFERAINIVGFGRGKHDIVRVINNWDLLPGRYPLVSGWNWGEGQDKMYPFDKFNNGGYTLVDKFGEIAKVKIQDFVFEYGQDVIYHYFVDLDGNGKIDEKTEEISRVLCRTTHDERVELEKLARGLIPENDVTLTINYSFMSPQTDMKKGWEGLKLGAYVESMIPDQIHRGRGEHSLLGLINDQRSDIILFREPSVENLSRALTEESTLVAKYDIIRVLNAAKRPYARDLACKYGIENEISGYQDTPVTSEKMYWGPVHTTAAWGIGIAGLYFAARGLARRRRDSRNEEYEAAKVKILGNK